ncbi:MULTISPECIES: ABC transporter substrate-binding protein [Paenibacillus]|jgi:ABC-type nitrate/sulfonate/bicarbonate transport system substrate-binding protein|uniref:NMT1/THI5 like domain protein n=1 Tax=Paenibacillus lactis 154 TaxID=743719 RepID=G4HH97_9BACL|nr:ABC transporter substrate-binding protein [Paenibacillus lactis]EHB63473.1 NMT1/THI5 like domain protein [Paenibacillus lactis 154]MCM3494213.1 ABC transporter substrate-binding protein [Paenibacillus lactis]GIO88995.1 ABC transporter substrate-binding protein [Paenibacillus lactis]
MKQRTWLSLLLACVLLLVASGCGASGQNGGSAPGKQETAGEGEQPAKLRDVQLMLDWSANTNHTGLYAAKELGYYEEEGLNVQIVQPGSGGTDAMVASGNVPFGISYQEGVTLARTQGLPLVSIAAIIQHNTSGFAAPKDRGIQKASDFEGKSYGGWGSPIEEAVMKSIMEIDGADVNKVNIVNIGDADYFTAVKRDIDFAWIYYAWTGIEAQLRGEPLDMIYVKDYSEQLDYYTPVIVTNEKLIADDPELVKAFMRATSKGYQYAIDHPEDAAALLSKAVPDLDAELVLESQKWLSPRYQDDAPRWGEQKAEVWSGYADWMFERKLLEKELDAERAFTNEFLPDK